MGIRTDLAVEFAADKTKDDSGIRIQKRTEDGIDITIVDILTDAAEKELGKPVGKYITLESDSSEMFDMEALRKTLSNEIRRLIGITDGDILIVGIGNTTITPDALGPKAASGVLATRHIPSKLAGEIGLNGLRPVSVISPGVLGQTGIEVKEIIEGTVERINPHTVILIDALAAREVSRLGRTVQLSDTGIAPGSGVGNTRAEISRKTLGVKCISIGVPTVVDAATLCFDLTGTESREHKPLIVTPREIDRLIDRSSKAISFALNTALQPNVDPEVLLSCV